MGLSSPITGLNAARWLVIVTVVVALSLVIFTTVFQAAKFDVQAFGMGMGALLFGGGGMMYLNPPTPVAK